MQFDIVLKNEKEGSYRLIILLLVVLHALFFIYLLFDESLRSRGVEGLIIILLYSSYRLLISKTNRQKFSFGPGFFFVFAVIYFSIPYVWVCDLILLVLSSVALQKDYFHFALGRIEQRNYPFKKYNWNGFSNVVVKDNILTLDFKNNKLFQGEIETPVNEKIFNAFTAEQLNKD